MNLTPKNVNRFILFKLPSAFFTGVRLIHLTNEEAVSRVRLKWMNQNPFKSLFWAVQGMAAELPTGILVMKAIRESKANMSMLVTHQSGSFTKKAVGTIHFTCQDGQRIQTAIQEAIRTKEGQRISLNSVGTDQTGEVVSNFTFEWSIKVKEVGHR
ncbi:DUF4442 domain-containing protein [Flavobacteriaceae bacterium F08102]|nr:DUF4442 domain-containing protein [Flavobacteriaceae bacterium F08102]